MIHLPPAALEAIPASTRATGHCAHAPESIGDLFPTRHGMERVVATATVLHSKRVVGWIYRTESGHFFAQANQDMTKSDQALSHTPVSGAEPKTYRPGFLIYSPIEEISRIPWSDLTIKACKKSDYSNKP